MRVTLDLPDALVERLEAEAARRGVTVQELAVAALREHYEGDLPGPNGDEDALDAFLGSLDSGGPAWASRDTHRLRQDADRRRLAARTGTRGHLRRSTT
jgi:hypothetical protein